MVNFYVTISHWYVIQITKCCEPRICRALYAQEGYHKCDLVAVLLSLIRTKCHCIESGIVVATGSTVGCRLSAIADAEEETSRPKASDNVDLLIHHTDYFNNMLIEMKSTLRHGETS